MNLISLLILFVLLGSTCGLRLQKQLRAEADKYESRSGSIPPLLFVKTHKTGSSTITNIVHRLGDALDMQFMLPHNNVHLGWPGKFPVESGNYAAPANQYDIICNHAVYNRKQMLAYLTETPSPFLFTILRDPISHLKSAFHYFAADRSNDKSLISAFSEEPSEESERIVLNAISQEFANGEDLWEHRIQLLKQMQQHPEQFSQAARARFLNGQAHDLGWYETSDYKVVAPDEDIQKWVENLGFDYVMLTDMFDESLVLLKEKLDLTLEQVSNAHFKARHYNDSEPTAEQHKELQDLSHVDFALYNHYKQKLLKEWERDGHSTDLDKLKELNKQIANACHHKHMEKCPWEMTADNVEYTKYLKQKQQSKR